MRIIIIGNIKYYNVLFYTHISCAYVSGIRIAERILCSRGPLNYIDMSALYTVRSIIPIIVFAREKKTRYMLRYIFAYERLLLIYS